MGLGGYGRVMGGVYEVGGAWGIWGLWGRGGGGVWSLWGGGGPMGAEGVGESEGRIYPMGVGGQGHIDPIGWSEGHIDPIGCSEGHIYPMEGPQGHIDPMGGGLRAI